MTSVTAQRNLERIGRYVITRVLGRGSTSMVYLAHDVQRGTDVALKLYHPDTVRPERAHTRRKLYVNEARLAGELNHPNLVSVLDAGESGDDAYVVTEYLRGATPLSGYTRLVDLLPQQKVAEILFACAKALDYAHRRGIIHRDIKPSNILLMPDGSPKIIDFGVAVHSLTGTQTVTGLVGSPSYMAPEQVKSGTATALSDLYSLGVVGYELLSSKRPFYGENLSHLVHQIIYATPPPLLKLRVSVPRALANVIERAMEKEPSRRFPNALAMAALLARVVSEFEQDAGRLELQDRFDIVRHLPFFRDFSYAGVWDAVTHSDWLNYSEGEEVVKAGVNEHAFYIVISGEMALERDGRQIDLLRRGETLGALSLMAGRAVRSRAVTLSPVLIMRIDAVQLEAMSPDCQLAFQKVFNRDLLRQLAAASAASRERDDQDTGREA